MSTQHLKDIMHSSNVFMRPFLRLVAIGSFGYVGYCLVSEGKTVENIRPNYEEYRRLKGLPETPIKHPGWIFKEQRIVPKEELKRLKN